MSTSSAATSISLHTADIALERDVFMRTLIRELAGALQDVVGLEDASGFISVVGQRMGAQINDSYRSALRVARLDPLMLGLEGTRCAHGL